MSIISIVGPKGGSGKTTITANLGILLFYEFGKKVLLVDGNITAPTLGLQFGITDKKNLLDDVLNDSIQIDQSIHVHSSGLHIIPAGLSLDQQYENMKKLKEKLVGIKEKYDFILIDCAPAIGSDVINSVKASDFILIVTNTEIPSITITIKMIKMLNTLNIPLLGLVLNKTDKKTRLKVSDIEELTGKKIIGIIPYDKLVSESYKHMMPITLYKKDSELYFAFKYLASFIINETTKGTETK